jgi:hypothetical protein
MSGVRKVLSLPDGLAKASNRTEAVTTLTAVTFPIVDRDDADPGGWALKTQRAAPLAPHDNAAIALPNIHNLFTIDVSAVLRDELTLPEMSQLL